MICPDSKGTVPLQSYSSAATAVTFDSTNISSSAQHSAPGKYVTCKQEWDMKWALILIYVCNYWEPAQDLGGALHPLQHLWGLSECLESMVWTSGGNRRTQGTARGFSKGAEQSRTCASSQGDKWGERCWQLHYTQLELRVAVREENRAVTKTGFSCCIWVDAGVAVRSLCAVQSYSDVGWNNWPTAAATKYIWN